MRVLNNPDGHRWLIFTPIVIDHDSGRLAPAKYTVNYAASVVCGFGKTRFPGVCWIELDARAFPALEEGEELRYHVRARQSEIRGALGLVDTRKAVTP